MGNYIITTPLGIKEAVNPETALYKWAKDVVDDEFLEIVEEDEIENKSVIGLAEWIIHFYSGGEEEIVIYQLHDDEDGEPTKFELDELDI